MTTKKNEIRGIEYGLILAVLTAICGVVFGYGALNTRVEANTEKLKQTVPRSEHEAIARWQVRYEQEFDKRMTRLENKVDRLIDRSK